MSRRKSKFNNRQWKIAQAQHRNQFKRRLREICALVGGEGIDRLIPEGEISKMYAIRSLPYKIEADSENSVSAHHLRAARAALPRLINVRKIPLVNEGPTVSLAECFEIGLGLADHVECLQGTEYSGASVVKQRLASLLQSPSLQDRALDELQSDLSIAGMFYSDLNTRLYWFSYQWNEKWDGTRGLIPVITMHAKTPEQIQISLDGLSRPATRLCWTKAQIGIKSVSVKASQLGIDGSFAQLPVDVFIQSHALFRLNERLDCVSVVVRQLMLVGSVFEFNAHKDEAGTFWIEYRLFDCKVGYLLAEMVEGVLVIRTFLFITNAGTPEGRRLQELVGFARRDREFLAIDKLSAFVSTDLRKNDDLRILFERADCAGLLEFHSRLGDFVEKKADESNVEFMVKYLEPVLTKLRSKRRDIGEQTRPVGETEDKSIEP